MDMVTFKKTKAILEKWLKVGNQIDINAVPTSLYEAFEIIGVLKTKLVDYERALKIIRMQCALEDFVQKMYPSEMNFNTGEALIGKPEEMSFYDALAEILSSQDKLFTDDVSIRVLRDRLTTNNIEPDIFMKFARWWFNQFPGKSYHRMAVFAPPLPSYNDIPAIFEMLQAVEIDEDIPALICIQIMLEPLF